MPPRLNLFAGSTGRNAAASLRRLQLHSTSTSSSTCARVSSRARSSIALLNSNSSAQQQQQQRRAVSSGSGSRDGDEKGKGLDEGVSGDQIPDIGQETAEIDRIVNKGGEEGGGAKPGEMGGCGKGTPEFEQGTPVQEILKRDKEAQKNMPKVMRDQFAGSSRSYSTSARQQQQQMDQSQNDPSIAAVASMIYNPQQPASAAMQPPEGYKFEPPSMSLPRTENVKRRYDPLVEQFTKLLMRDGKLSHAQKTMEAILNNLRQSPPPKINPNRPLLNAPPSPQLPLNPILYLTLIIDSVSPLLKIRQQKGAAGGGMSLQIPVPLPLRRRRRTAIRWILDASDKRKDSKLSARVSSELMAVAEGKGAAWDKRGVVHKMGISARTNIKWAPRR